MIDYIKILLEKIDIKRLEETLEFFTKVSQTTGELSSHKVAEYHYCTVVIYDSGLVLFKGSLHKLYNSIKGIKAPNHYEVKGFNGNQFTLSNINETITHLSVLFNCKPQQMRIQNIEFGINTTPAFKPQQFIKGLLYHNAKSFEFRYNGSFAQVPHQRYLLKIYHKSKQYKMDAPTLRLELKIIKTEYIRELGIKTLEDISQQSMNKAKQLLLDRFAEVVYFDYTINKETFSESQIKTLNNYSNPRYWLNELNHKNRYYNRKKLLDFIFNYSDNLQQQIMIDVEHKFRQSNHSYIELFSPNN